MAITPICDICGMELSSFGAIVLGPPEEGQVQKFHVCTVCYQNKLLDLLRT